MNRSPILIGLALAFAMPAFAQDPAASSTAMQATEAQPPMAQSTDDANKPAAPAKAAPKKHKKHASGADHGHVAGDPPIIDHSADHLIVEPTSSGKMPAKTN
jgi:hypothetical protein